MKKIIFLGDSITDAYHNLGVDIRGLGNGYVECICRKMEETGKEVKIFNRGHDGFTAAGLQKRLLQDCILQQPDIVSILIGCNDVGIMMNTGKTLEQQRFKEIYEEIIVEIQNETEADIICMAPFIFPRPEKYLNWIPEIRSAEAIIKKTAQKYGLTFLPLHDELQKAAKKCGYNDITVDGIHLTRKGAEVVADLWMKSFGERVN